MGNLKMTVFMLDNKWDTRKIEITLNKNKVSIRDYGRGIPLGIVIDCVSKIKCRCKIRFKSF